MILKFGERKICIFPKIYWKYIYVWNSFWNGNDFLIIDIYHDDFGSIFFCWLLDGREVASGDDGRGHHYPHPWWTQGSIICLPIQMLDKKSIEFLLLSILRFYISNLAILIILEINPCVARVRLKYIIKIFL
jgi:hypothetical protein